MDSKKCILFEACMFFFGGKLFLSQGKVYVAKNMEFIKTALLIFNMFSTTCGTVCEKFGLRRSFSVVFKMQMDPRHYEDEGPILVGPVCCLVFVFGAVCV